MTSGTNKAEFADCDVVIEAVFEELDVTVILAESESWVRADPLLLTNTSSLSVEAMGDSLAQPDPVRQGQDSGTDPRIQCPGQNLPGPGSGSPRPPQTIPGSHAARRRPDRAAYTRRSWRFS